MSARSWHCRLGWVAGAVALAWASTGFLHPIMTWTAPRPAVQAPPPHGAESAGVIAPAAALAAQGWETAAFVRLLPTPTGAAWLAENAEGARIAVDAKTGAPAPDAERARAELLARYYAGRADAPVAAARRLDAFSTRYPGVNRILPIWEVQLATPDGLTLYVDPKADRLTTVTNGPRRVMLAVFQNVHTLKFLEPVEALRIAAILALVGTVLATTLIGMAMLARGKGRGLRGWHRAVGWVAAPLAIAFTGSGLFHLLVTSEFAAPPIPKVETFAIADLTALPRVNGAGALDLVATRGGDGRALWRVAGDEGALYFSGDGRVASLDDAARARMIAGREGDVRVVERFDAAYGFVNKRLPVMGVGDAVFVDLREGLIAGRAAPGIAGVEGWTFDTIHKWEPVAALIGRRNRDYLTMLAVAIIALTAAFGLALLVRRPAA